MKKLLLAAALTTSLLAGCTFEEEKIVYEGVERPVYEVEEIIADQLEVENPGLDLEVGIAEEADD